MKNLSSLINSGIDSMDSIFSSRELLVWMLRNYKRDILKVYNKYLYSKNKSNTFLDLFFNLIRKSCKIGKISVLEMPDERNNFTINYIFIKNIKADHKLLRD